MSSSSPTSTSQDLPRPHSSSPEPTSSKPLPRKPKKKPKPLTTKQRALALNRLQTLTHLHPKPFLPPTSDLDVSLHEPTLRLLGLWDFANLRLDSSIRKDLLVDLLAFYDRSARRSFVKEVRVSVSRSDLARALELPAKKGGFDGEVGLEGLGERAVVSALVKFLLGWVVVVGEAGDELGIVPDEAQGAIRLIEAGQAHKVDWAGVMWAMVEKEILDCPKSGCCYYASHLQHLIRAQKPGLFDEDEVLSVEEEEDVEGTGVGCGAGEEAVGNSEDVGLEKMEEIAGFGVGDDRVEAAEEENQQQDQQEQQWLLGGKSEVSSFCLRPCSSSDVQGMEIDSAIAEDCKVDGSEMNDGNLGSKFPSLDNCADLLQGIDAGNVSFSLPLQQELDTTAGEFLASPVEAHKNMSSNFCPSGSSLFGNAEKRLNDKIHEEEDDGDDDFPNFSHGINPKRMRTDGSWGPAPSGFDSVMEQFLNCAGKAKLMYEHKEHEIMNAHMQLQMLSETLEQKDQVIQSLERSRLEDQHKRQLEISQFEHERTALSHLVVGYQKALRGTREALAESIKQSPNGVETLYEDVAGSGGVVLTVREFERQRFENSEKERQRLESIIFENNMLIKKVNEFTKEWSGKFENYEDQVQRLTRRLEGCCGGITLLKDNIAKNKDSDEKQAACEIS